MMFSTPTAFAFFALVSTVFSHMEMSSPVPFGKSTLNNSPLAADGSDFPCKQRTGVYDAEGASNTIAAGGSHNLTFIGQAVHGGGSCQISITYDAAPTKDSVWKVIHSIQGGCPMKNTAGNAGDSATAASPDTYSFTMPADVPTGTAVLAWTWFNKVGNREMYMNCAPITITAAASKRTAERDEEAFNGTISSDIMARASAFDALPNMFVANVPTSDCVTVEGGDLLFPNPGTSLERFNPSDSLIAPSGSKCGATVAQSSGSAGASSSAASTSAAKPAATTLATSTKSANQGGVFVTVAPAVSATSISVAPVIATSAIASSSQAAVKTTSAATPASTGTISTGSAIVAGTACSTEGMWNCISGTMFQECASGSWSVTMSVAAGTECTGGQSMDMGIAAIAKRSFRHSRFASHLRRHNHQS